MFIFIIVALFKSQVNDDASKEPPFSVSLRSYLCIVPTPLCKDHRQHDDHEQARQQIAGFDLFDPQQAQADAQD